MNKVAKACIASGLIVPFIATLYSMIQFFGRLSESAEKVDATSYISPLIWINGFGALLVIFGMTLLVISSIRTRRMKVARVPR